MAVMAIWGITAFKGCVNKTQTGSSWSAAGPAWTGWCYRAAPIVAKPAKLAASYSWEFFLAAGTAMLISSFISMAVLKHQPGHGSQGVGQDLQAAAVHASITFPRCSASAFLANYSGMSFTLGLAFANYTGKLFPLFSPVIGWLGVFLTGSVTSSAALFGKLQQVTAVSLGMNPVLTTSANLFGASWAS